MYEVEENVPMPQSSASLRGYPWAEMEPDVGSFAINPEEDGREAGRILNSVGTSGREWCKRNEPTATVKGRKISDTEVRFYKVSVATDDADEE